MNMIARRFDLHKSWSVTGNINEQTGVEALTRPAVFMRYYLVKMSFS